MGGLTTTRRRESGFSHCLHGGAKARDEFEVKDDARSASPPLAALRVLEFEFISRKMLATQSMRRRR